MERHVYKPPRGSPKLNLFLAILGGAFMTFAVFYVIPLMKKLEQAFRPERPPEIEQLVIDEPPEEYVEPEDEPPPEEKPEEITELDEPQQEMTFDLDMGSLAAGVGSITIDLDPKFDIQDSPDMFDTGDLDQQPRPASTFQPQYPASLKKDRKGGRVVVRAMVDESGTVSDATIKQSSGFSELDRAAIEAIRRWRFSPAIKDGRKVRAAIVQPFTFRVQ